MLDAFMAIWMFLWAFFVPVLLVLFMSGVGILAIFILPRQTENLWAKSESIGFGRTVAAMTKWFIWFYFEFRSFGDDVNSSEAGMANTILSLIAISVCFWAAQLVRCVGLPWIVIGSLCALIAVFGA